MKKKLIISLGLFLLLSTYSIQNSFSWDQKLKIKEIIIENNYILNEKKLISDLSFLYETNLFFFKSQSVKKKLDQLEFLDSFKIKKIYPNKLKITIFEKKPIFVLFHKKKKFLYTSDHNVINFIQKKEFDNLPLVFSDKESFKAFYYDLVSSNFPLHIIKSFYFFKSNRWDLITQNNQTIKLPSKNYIKSLENFIDIKERDGFKNYKIFDYRISNQLILK